MFWYMFIVPTVSFSPNLLCLSFASSPPSVPLYFFRLSPLFLSPSTFGSVFCLPAFSLSLCLSVSSLFLSPSSSSLFYGCFQEKRYEIPYLKNGIPQSSAEFDGSEFRGLRSLPFKISSSAEFYCHFRKHPNALRITVAHVWLVVYRPRHKYTFYIPVRYSRTSKK
jgi:hypothetical protein